MTRDASLQTSTRSSSTGGNQSITTTPPTSHHGHGGRTFSNPNSSVEFYNRTYYNSNSNHSTPGLQQMTSLNNNYSLNMLSSGSDPLGFGNQFQPQTGHAGTQSVSSRIQGVSSKLRETIHSGQFMVSDFEPESEVLDEEYEAGMPVPSEEDSGAVNYGASGGSEVASSSAQRNRGGQSVSVIATNQKISSTQQINPNEGTLVLHRSSSGGNSMIPFNMRSSGYPGTPQTPIIDGSLTKLFQCMSLAYRQKLTSPKWNPFKGVRLRWKDKIRLNNVIWRCWHMQFILKQKAMVCQFASPLDVNQHNKPEAVVMEGKYWKRKLSTVAAEYKKWRLFYRNRIMGWTHHHPLPDLHPVSLDGFDWNRPGTFGNGPMSNVIFDDELLMDFSDTLFSSLTSQPFAFPNPRELTRAGMVADFIQPGLVQLQPNIDDFMDTLEPLPDYLNSKFLPSVSEELDSIESSQENLLSVDLPDMIQNRTMHQNPFIKQSSGNQLIENSQQQLTYAGSDAANNLVESSMFYPIIQMNQSTNRSSSSSQNHPNLSSSSAGTGSVNSSTPVNHHKECKASAKNSSGYAANSNFRDDLFAVPKGKPRGRSRSGNRQHSTSHQSTHKPLNTVSHQQQQQNPSSQSQMGHSGHGQMSNSISNSHTLLSHLLTTPGHVHFGGSGGNTAKSSSSNASSHQLQVMPHGNQSGGVTMPGTLIDIQQHQQQPWNPKNANETISPTVSLNFVSKSMIQGTGNHNTSNRGATGGNVSPPLMSSTPSPPMVGASGPPSPPKFFRAKNEHEREHRRVCHINAEQKRRCNIKNGFDMLHSLIPQLSHNPNAKVSKAAMLQKGAEYIRQLKIERSKLKQEIETHRQEVETLNSSINNCQSMLPATGAPVSRQRTNKMKEMFDQWIRLRTLENWKFWLFSILIRPLLDSYNNAVSTASLDELCRTVLAWVDQHCSLVDLRPAVLNSLRFLCTTTDILTNPGNLPEEANQAVNRLETALLRNSQGGNSESQRLS